MANGRVVANLLLNSSLALAANVQGVCFLCVAFDDTVSAAAFLAAISRVLDVQFTQERQTVVIWVSAVAADGASVVYLKDAALALVSRVFGEPPISQTVRGVRRSIADGVSPWPAMTSARSR